MPELNKANRQVCDVRIRILKTMMPFLNFDTANTTTAGLSGDSVYAMAKGSRRIAFPNPVTGTMTIEAQVYPFKLFSLFSDGVVSTTAAYDAVQTVESSEEGSVSITLPTDGSVVSGTVFVYPDGSYGDESALIEGTWATNKFTATTASKIAVGSKYTVAYLVSRTKGVKKISFNNKKLPQDYYITMETLDKDEEGLYAPFVMTAYKASIQRTFDLSFSSEGDPATVSMTFDLMEDKDGNILDMIELTEESQEADDSEQN